MGRVLELVVVSLIIRNYSVKKTEKQLDRILREPGPFL